MSNKGIDPFHKDVVEVRFDFIMPRYSNGEYFLTFGIALGEHESHIQLSWYNALIKIYFQVEEKYCIGLENIPYEVTLK